jgi:hypothetical protein
MELNKIGNVIKTECISGRREVEEALEIYGPNLTL